MKSLYLEFFEAIYNACDVLPHVNDYTMTIIGQGRAEAAYQNGMIVPEDHEED